MHGDQIAHSSITNYCTYSNIACIIVTQFSDDRSQLKPTGRPPSRLIGIISINVPVLVSKTKVAVSHGYIACLPPCLIVPRKTNQIVPFSKKTNQSECPLDQTLGTRRPRVPERPGASVDRHRVCRRPHRRPDQGHAVLHRSGPFSSRQGCGHRLLFRRAIVPPWCAVCRGVAFFLKRRNCYCMRVCVALAPTRPADQ